jgi:peptide/nickel transport system permease protein
VGRPPPTGRTPTEKETSLRFLLQRLAFYLVAFWVALSINFMLPRLMPGSPSDAVLEQLGPELQRTPGLYQQIVAEYGGKNESALDLVREYPHYIWNMLTLHLGESIRYKTPVSSIIRQTLPYSIFVAGTAVFLAFVIGTFLGMVCGWRRGGVLDSTLPATTLFVQAFPPFVIALLAIYFLALGQGPLHAQWFPTSLAYDNQISPSWSWTFVGSVIRHGELPILVLTVTTLGGWLLGMRNTMISNVAEDYITTAQAKGVPSHRIMFSYAGRNSIIPPVTAFATQLAAVVVGAIVIETVFSYPGVGLTMNNAALGHDYPLLQALLLVISACFLIANFVMDSVYVFLDPRSRVT